MLGYTPAYVYEPVWYLHSDGESKIGRWRGVAESILGDDCCWLLPKLAKPIAISTVWAISRDKHSSQAFQEAIKVLNECIKSKIRNSKTNEEAFDAVGGEYPSNVDLLIDDNVEEDDWTQDAEVKHQEADEYTLETFEGYLTASDLLPSGEEVLQAKVVGRKQQDANCWSCSQKSHPRHPGD